ncbi:MAG: flagellar export chaperone FliS [Chromatiales bacterium]|nr:flagellar export chaperone FliS [Gammaproteobacteria bacterium]MCP5352461.1 flagellar export chaperone FliS [Chromatiales bacterium]
MYHTNSSNPAASYSSVGIASAIVDAKPAELVYMLFESAVDRLAAAKGYIEREQTARKGEMISKATAIIVELQRSLDMEKGGEFAERLDALYDYMLRQLTQANLHNDVAKIDEVIKLLTPIRDAWKVTSEKN